MSGVLCVVGTVPWTAERIREVLTNAPEKAMFPFLGCRSPMMYPRLNLSTRSGISKQDSLA